MNQLPAPGTCDKIERAMNAGAPASTPEQEWVSSRLSPITDRFHRIAEAIAGYTVSQLTSPGKGFRYAAGAPGRAKALAKRRAAFKAARKSRKANRARGGK